MVVAYDAQTGKHDTIYGMGRLNHENDVAIPGYDDLVVLSGDDPFTTTPASSQLYMYRAADTDALWADEGTLYALSAINTAKNDYFDIQPGDPAVDVEFVPVRKNIATGKDSSGNELLSTALGYPAPARWHA